MTNDYGNEELHKVLLFAMKDIDAICEKNNLKYFIHAGTLLGAANHHGFIPWDDDVDLIMFKEDFIKLKNIVKEKYSKYYYFQTFNNDKFHMSKIAKLRIKDTKMIEYGTINTKEKRQEISIDISCLFSVPDSFFCRKIQKKVIYVINILLGIKSGFILSKSLNSRFFLLPLSKIKKTLLGQILDIILMYYEGKKTNLVGILCYSEKNPYTGVDGYENDLFLRKWFDQRIKLVFEDIKLYAIKNYRSDLIRRYGKNYFLPFPEEKRKTKHNVKKYFISKELKKRIGIT